MLDQSGTRRIRYEDVFRALGHYLDANQLRPLTLAETPDGFVLKAHRRRTENGIESEPPLLFANDDIDALLEAAYLRRRMASAEHATPRHREPQAQLKPIPYMVEPATEPPAAPSQPPTSASNAPPATGQPAPPKLPGGRGWLKRS